MAQTLPPEKIRAALTAINAWRADPAAAVACPVCGAPGLDIADQSARPYAEWYVLACSACGLEQTLQIPLSPPSP